MRAPILPYYGDQFLGVKPPKAITYRQAAYGGAGFAYPSPVSANDGSYILFQTASVNLYNKTQTLVWSLTPSGTPLASATHILAIYYNVANSTLYGIAYNSANANYMLFKFNSPAVSNSVSAVGSAFTIPTGTINTTVVQNVLNNCTLCSNGSNLRLRIINTLVIDVILNITTGAKISETTLVQGGITIASHLYGLIYTSVDSTIEFGGLTISNGKLHGIIMRNGYFAKVPIMFINTYINTYLTVAPIGNIVCAVFADYVRFSAVTEEMPVGVTSFNRADFDRWLVDICDAIGI